MMIFKSKKELLKENKELKETIKTLQTALDDCNLFIRNKAVIEANLKIELQKALNKIADLEKGNE